MSRFKDQEEILSVIWKRLSRAVRDAKHPYRTPALATVDPRGEPQVRKVVLRSVNEEQGILRFYSDSRTDKIKALEHGSTLSWLFWDARKKLQVRARGTSHLLHPDEADRIWRELSQSQRKDYAALQPPGSIIPEPGLGFPEDWEEQSLEETNTARLHFRAVDCLLTDIDVLQLDREGHQRAQFKRANADQEWEASWVIP